ncbi:transcriptional regulator BetI [Rhodobacteraceae bacterium CCMM004]|nr:transcriptional regulator BetI [Rhodobacteraceae bacterium CCMM004]
MPKLGMEPIRRDALVKAAIAEIGAAGSLDVTVARIARRAGVSTALAHHYFGGKEALFLATMRHILSLYGAAVRQALVAAPTPEARLQAVVAASFGPENFAPATVSAWLNLYVHAHGSPDARRLLHVYQRRLRSNLRHALRPLTVDAERLADTAGALIDGLYIRAALGQDVRAAEATSQVLAALGQTR